VLSLQEVGHLSPEATALTAFLTFLPLPFALVVAIVRQRSQRQPWRGVAIALAITLGICAVAYGQCAWLALNGWPNVAVVSKVIVGTQRGLRGGGRYTAPRYETWSTKRVALRLRSGEAVGEISIDPDVHVREGDEVGWLAWPSHPEVGCLTPGGPTINRGVGAGAHILSWSTVLIGLVLARAARPKRVQPARARESRSRAQEKKRKTKRRKSLARRRS